MNFKSFIFALSLGFICSHAVAQDASPRREIGLQFNNVNFSGTGAFSGFYKKEKKENVYRRYRFLYGNFNTQFLLGNDISGDFFRSTSIGAGFAIGSEKRKALDEKLMFYQGPEFALTAGTFSRNNHTSLAATARFGWVLGLQHSFNDRWAINLESIPGVGINLTESSRHDYETSVQGGFSNTFSIGLVRKF